MTKWIVRVLGVLVAGGIVAGGATLVIPRVLNKSEGPRTSVMSDVEFSIAEEQKPNFSGSVGDMQNIGIKGEPMYEEDGGVAYEIDPVTMERISGPLDIDTHEPVGDLDIEDLDAEVYSKADMTSEAGGENDINPLSVSEQEEPVTEKPGVLGEEPGVGKPVSSSETEVETETATNSGTAEPTEYTKLPNTGKFLEDD